MRSVPLIASDAGTLAFRVPLHGAAPLRAISSPTDGPSRSNHTPRGLAVKAIHRRPGFRPVHWGRGKQSPIVRRPISRDAGSASPSQHDTRTLQIHCPLFLQRIVARLCVRFSVQRVLSLVDYYVDLLAIVPHEAGGLWVGQRLSNEVDPAKKRLQSTSLSKTKTKCLYQHKRQIARWRQINAARTHKSLCLPSLHQGLAKSKLHKWCNSHLLSGLTGRATVSAGFSLDCSDS